MPADARVAPCPGARGSMTLTLAPLLASSYATVQPTIPAPTTMTDGVFFNTKDSKDTKDTKTISSKRQYC